jgi:hypothetical protein
MWWCRALDHSFATNNAEHLTPVRAPSYLTVLKADNVSFLK